MNTKELEAALRRMAPAMMAAWDKAVANDLLWELRAEGPRYRETLLLGRFRWYRRFRVWLLRRRLRLSK